MPSPLARRDTSPRAPGQLYTPHELAEREGLIGAWLICRGYYNRFGQYVPMYRDRRAGRAWWRNRPSHKR